MIDHVPVLEPITKSAETVREPAAIAARTAAALDLALARASGPTFVDFPNTMPSSSRGCGGTHPFTTNAAVP